MSRILLVLPIAAFEHNGSIYIDSQAHNGLRQWLENFDCVTLACRSVERPDESVTPLNFGDRVKYVPLPDVFTPHRFLATLPSVWRTLKREIANADYLQFAIGGLWGDWPSVACIIARREGRPYAVWTDKVESSVHRFHALQKAGTRRVYALLTAALMRRYERTLIGRSSIGLFHGADCYDAYNKYCDNPHLVHDIHIKPHDVANSADVSRRLQLSPINVVYAGRVAEEKGVWDWLNTIQTATEMGADIKALWFGNGPLLDEAIKIAGPNVKFCGPVSHSEVLKELKKAHVFLFCHKTRESPRCLIEALACGLPLLGYHSKYAHDLMDGAGILTEHSPVKLAEQLVAISYDSLTRLSDAALRVGAGFSDEAVFKHRSDLIKTLQLVSSP